MGRDRLPGHVGSARGAAAPLAALAGFALAGVALPLLTRDSYHLDVAATVAKPAAHHEPALQMSTGQLNMAHVSFMGIGAYASALLVMRAGCRSGRALARGPAAGRAAAVPSAASPSG